MKNIQQQKTKTKNIIVPESHCPTPSGPSSSSGCLSAWHTVPTLSAVSLQEPANTSFSQLFLFRNLPTPHHFISCFCLRIFQNHIILSSVSLQEPASTTSFCQLFLLKNLPKPHHFVSCLSVGTCQYIILSAVPVQEPANSPFCQLLTYQLTSLSFVCFVCSRDSHIKPQSYIYIIISLTLIVIISVLR